jgi:hypothetical protein
MKNSNSDAASQELIQCVEVLISRTSIAQSLRWTLSVYSLENSPVSRYPAIHNCDVYHFMNFDWKRTIKQLLEDHKVPYSVIQYFSSQSIHAGVERNLAFDENTILSAVDQLEETYGGRDDARVSRLHSSVRHQATGLVAPHQ